MPIRDLVFETLALDANVESSVVIPPGASSIEISQRVLPAELRMSNVAGQTANGNKYKTIRSDWWPSDPRFKIPPGTRLYFRSTVQNTVELLFGIE